MRLLKSLAVSMLLLAMSVTAFAQNRTVTGVVLDTNNEPLIGVAVIVDGTTNGAMTDVDGTFSLTVPSGDVVLDVTSLGYVSQKVTVPANQAKVTVLLVEDNLLIEETVVVGYGTQKKVNLTGAISTVDSDDLTNRTSSSVTNMLQGSVPGLNITTSSGTPGSSGSINIRGVTSINSASPIVVIDGAIGDLSAVNPNDVESISVVKDAAAAAVYGARAAYGVILVTTKSGGDNEGKATVRYSGRFGWESPTTSTEYETRGYWSAYTVDKFWQADAGKKYTTYTDYDMAQLLARVNDKTEHPDRPWIVEDVRNGKKQWVYYCNTDWYHELYRDEHPLQQHSISVSGGNKAVKYFLSGSYDNRTGIIKVRPDVFQKYNLRSKLDFNISKYVKMSNNTSYYSSSYNYPGVGSVEDTFAYLSRHALASFPLRNPDGSGTYATPMISGNYNIGNGRHLVLLNDKNVNLERKNDFANTTEIKITPVKQFNIVGNFTYRMYQNNDTYRQNNIEYREYPDEDMLAYTLGAGENYLKEVIKTNNYLAGNVFATYEDTYKDAHHLTIMGGMNMESWKYKRVSSLAKNLMSDTLNDLNLIGPDATGNVLSEVAGGQNAYSLMGFFARINYDYKGRYLAEVSGRYDGTSRFGAGHRWGLFPSGSVGWRISEEPFFKNAKSVVNNLKLRASYGSLGNQNVDYYSYMRTISFNYFAGYSFGEGTTMSRYSSLSNPISADLTWETSQQYNVGIDAAFLGNKLEFTAEGYIRDTKNMLTDGDALPAVFGADPPKANSADLRTKGYELSLSWRDEFNLGGHPFGYSVRGTLSDYVSHITKFDNPTKTFGKSYYEGMRIGDIWGFEVDGLFATDEEAKEYTSNVLDCSYINGRMTGGFLAGDLKYVDLDGDGILGIGKNTVDEPGDRKILGNSLASLQYGLTVALDWRGFDISAFFQGTGNHYWYPAGMNMAFWGTYSYSYVTFLQKDFIQRCWSEDNPDAYFPRPRSYSATGGELSKVNSMYLQNIRYLRFKNLTVGYSLPKKWVDAMKLQKVRLYFTGENLAYWSPLKKNCKYIDPESAFRRDTGSASAYDHMSYPWQKTMMFGIDITF
jgi:TonB-linked SusC/RagA family outer membrane protein